MICSLSMKAVKKEFQKESNFKMSWKAQFLISLWLKKQNFKVDLIMKESLVEEIEEEESETSDGEVQETTD